MHSESGGAIVARRAWIDVARECAPDHDAGHQNDGPQARIHCLGTSSGRLFELLPRSVAQMALFAVNTGCREQEVCQSRWDWEVSVAELQTSVFVFPAGFGGRPGRSGVKNREDRVVVLNDVAKRVIDSQCGLHRQFLFVSSKGQPRKPLRYMNNTALQTARKAAGLSQVRVHDLKHTFGRRLRTAGVPLETRKVLLGHKTGDIASHYSAPELAGTDTRVECDTQSAGIDLVASGCKAGGQR